MKQRLQDNSRRFHLQTIFIFIFLSHVTEVTWRRWGGRVGRRWNLRFIVLIFFPFPPPPSSVLTTFLIWLMHACSFNSKYSFIIILTMDRANCDDCPPPIPFFPLVFLLCPLHPACLPPLPEDLDDLRMEGVTGLAPSGCKFSQGRSSYQPEPQAKVTLNICSRCAR